MSAQTDAEVVRAGYEAFAKGDLEAVSRLIARDVRWHVPGRSALAGTYEGQDEVLEFFGRLMERSGGTFSIEVHDLLASDDHVVVLARETAERGGSRLGDNAVHVWHLEDGVAKEFWSLDEDLYQVDAFWG